MTNTIQKQARGVMIVALVGGLVSSMMYVSFAFGLRSGIKEDTVYILPQC